MGQMGMPVANEPFIPPGAEYNKWTPDSTSSVVNSPYADSVESVTGKPKNISGPATGGGITGLVDRTNMRGNLDDWAGLYTPQSDNVAINALPWSNRNMVESTVAHELAHHMDFDGLSGLKTREEWAKAVAGRKPPKTSYAATNSTEHFAESFLTAMHAFREADKMMRDGRKPVPELINADIEKMDNYMPGSRYMLGKILQSPKFRDTLLGQYLMGDVKMKPVVVTK